MTLTSTKYQNRNRSHIRGATGAFGRGGSFRAGCKYLASLARHCGLVSPGWVTQASRKGAASNTDVSPIRRATSSTLPEPSLTYCKILRASYSVPDLSSFNSSSALSSSAFNSELLRRAAENRVSPSSVEYEQSESLTRHLEQAGLRSVLDRRSCFAFLGSFTARHRTVSGSASGSGKWLLLFDGPLLSFSGT